MDMGLRNKVVLVTGSSKGIGKGIAQAFLKEGSKVCITGRNPDTLKATETEFNEAFPGQVMSFTGDFTDEKTIKACHDLILQSWQVIDVLCLNVGTGKSESGWKVSDQAWTESFNINFFGAVKV